MKRFVLLAALTLSISACAGTVAVPSIPVAPVVVANRTALDEEARNGIELGYKAFRFAMELGVDTGKITGARATAVRRANTTAYNAILVMRQAYQTANSADWLAAARSANIAVEQAVAVARGN